ncbi:MAG TPA: ATP-binding protein [Ktedonobacteraceae bacterium]|nr:ATP-binding protein [Ktedonobacteraceae bacterium]
MTVAPPFPDLASIAGHLHAKRALEVAACGGHHLALVGPPGTGKTLLARALFGLMSAHEPQTPLPLLEGQAAMTWVEAALQGNDGPGDHTQGGIVFLDRLDCFGYSPLQIQRLGVVLDRQPGRQMVLTCQPCPCGRYGDPMHECSCTTHLILRHQRRMRALFERVALTVEIPRLDYEHQMDARPAEGSARVAARVREGAARQQERFAGQAISCNAHMDHPQILRWCEMDAPAQKLYKAAYRQLHISSRAAEQVLAVARTIADLATRERLEAHHVAEALQYQPRF